MREYQRKKNNPWRLPQNLYMRVLYTIRDYNRIKAEQNTEAHLSEISAIETALLDIPEFFRESILNNILYDSYFPLGADERTYRRYKQRYIYSVAKYLNLI